MGIEKFSSGTLPVNTDTERQLLSKILTRTIVLMGNSGYPPLDNDSSQQLLFKICKTLGAHPLLMDGGTDLYRRIINRLIQLTGVDYSTYRARDTDIGERQLLVKILNVLNVAHIVGGGPYSRVQFEAYGATIGFSGVAKTFSNQNAAGNAILVSASTRDGNPVTGVTDSKGNSYSLVKSIPSVTGQNLNLCLYAAFGIKAGTNQVTVHTSSYSFIHVTQVEYSGVAAVDVAATAIQSQTLVASFSTKYAAEMIFGTFNVPLSGAPNISSVVLAGDSNVNGVQVSFNDTASQGCVSAEYEWLGTGGVGFGPRSYTDTLTLSGATNASNWIVAALR